MTIWLAIIFGIVQGATEFLPVSSSGHLVLLNKIFGVSESFISFGIILHIATLVAVIIVLKNQILELLKHPFKKNALMLYLSTAITLILVLLFKDFFISSFYGEWLPICFMITAIILTITETFSKKKTHKIRYGTSVAVGLAQGLAVLPGISRSGATICAGLLEGAKRNEVAEYSFILSIPIILASLAYEIFSCVKTNTPFFDVAPLPLLVSFVFALITGILCIKVMLNFVKKTRLYPFAIYLVFLSILSLFIM